MTAVRVFLLCDDPPQKVKLSFDGLAENTDGLCSMEDLLNRFDDAINSVGLPTIMSIRSFSDFFKTIRAPPVKVLTKF